MRTNIDIDDTLMAAARRPAALPTKREAVEEAAFSRRRKVYEGLLALQGQLQDDSDAGWAQTSAPAVHESQASYVRRSQPSGTRPWPSRSSPECHARQARGASPHDSGRLQRLDRLLRGERPVAALRQCLGDPGMDVGMADLVLFEVMRGFREGKAYAVEAGRLMASLPQVEIGGAANALLAAERYRRLRQTGRNRAQPLSTCCSPATA